MRPSRSGGVAGARLRGHAPPSWWRATNEERVMRLRTSIVAAALCGALAGCGDNELEGPIGPIGPSGPRGPAGEDGADGTNGMNGMNGQDGMNGAACGQGGST